MWRQTGARRKPGSLKRLETMTSRLRRSLCPAGASGLLPVPSATPASPSLTDVAVRLDTRERALQGEEARLGAFDDSYVRTPFLGRAEAPMSVDLGRGVGFPRRLRHLADGAQGM